MGDIEGAAAQVHCRHVPFPVGMRDTLPCSEIWRFCRVVHGLQAAGYPARFLQEGREERAPADGVVLQPRTAQPRDCQVLHAHGRPRIELPRVLGAGRQPNARNHSRPRRRPRQVGGMFLRGHTASLFIKARKEQS